VHFIVVNKQFKIQICGATHKPIVAHGHLHEVAALEVLSHTGWRYRNWLRPFHFGQPKYLGKVDQNFVRKFLLFLIGIDSWIPLQKNHLLLC
jgi:hypothetical protein